MTPLDLLLHLGNLFLLPIGAALIASALAKLLGGETLRATVWGRLALWSSVAAVLVVLAGLALDGREGLMLTHGAMVLSIALALGLASVRR